jgi:lipid A disaccharide synthetase
MVAGETSGDLLAGLLLDGFKARWPALTSSGIGGPHMAKRGFESWWPSEKLAVRGYVEVLRHYREIVGIRDQLKQRLLDQRPDIFVGVDAPDFNLDLEAALKGQGIKTVHFVSPSIWAWRADRVEKIRRSVDHVLCIFPFEPPLLAAHGIAATYVGHPLANVIPLQPDRAAARRALGLRDDSTVIAILPGSRKSEIQYLAQRFFTAAALIRKSQPAIQFVVPAIPGLEDHDSAHSRRGRHAGPPANHLRGSRTRTGRLRRHLDRQRHGHAGGRALQAAHGDRLQHELAVLADHAAQKAAALGGPSQHPVPGLCCARAAAGPGHARGPGCGSPAMGRCKIVGT